MKIAHVIIKFSKKHWGGAEEFILNTCSLLQEKENDVVILAPNVFDDKKNEKVGGVIVKRFKYFYPYLGSKNKELLAKRGTGVISIGILKEIALGDYDIVHLHLHNSLSTSIAYLCKGLKIKFVLHIHSPYVEEKEFLTNRNTVYSRNNSQNLLKNYAIKINNCIRKVVSTKKVLQFSNGVFWANGLDFNTFSKKYPQKKAFFIPNGFTIEGVTGGDGKEFRKNNDIDDKIKIILYIANFYYIKNQIHLLKIFKKMIEYNSSLKLVLVGRISDNDYYGKMIEFIDNNNLKDSVILINGLDHGSKEFKDIFNSCNLFVMPSIYEAFSLVLVESMANRKTIVANNVGGNSCIINNEENGFFVDMINQESIADSAKIITDIINDEDRLNDISDLAYQIAVEKYTWFNITNNLIKIYNDLIEE